VVPYGTSAGFVLSAAEIAIYAHVGAIAMALLLVALQALASMPRRLT
jgi:hypothetical protein